MAYWGIVYHAPLKCRKVKLYFGVKGIMVLLALLVVRKSLIWKAFSASTFLLLTSFFWHAGLSVFAVHLPHKRNSI